MRRFGLLVGVVGIIAVIAAGGYFLIRKVLVPQTTLTVWTLPGNETALKQAADIFHAQNRSVGVKIVPVNEQVYELRALYSLAGQKGTKDIAPPDVWIMPNEWLVTHRNKLVAAPEGSLDTGVHGYTASPAPSATPVPALAKGRTNTAIMAEDFGPIATQDLVRDDKVWGVPLNSDTLALYYDKTKIASPPKTWQELVDLTKKVTTRSGSTVSRSVVALGDASTVDHGLDILSILMLQNGTEMIRDKDNLAGYNLPQANGSLPAATALDFYTSFTKSDKETYSWNATFGRSLKALAEGKTLMALGYASDASLLPEKTIAVAPLPQTDMQKPQTYGRYLAATVTKQASDSAVAWQFVSLLANPDIQEAYAKTVGGIPARRDVAQRMPLAARLKVFAGQVGQAVNWPKKEVAVADGSLNEALALVLKQGKSAQTALDVAAKAYTAFLQTDSGLPSDPKNLSLWQSEDDTTNYASPIESFLGEHKQVPRVVVSKHAPERYEWELLNASSARLGPDVAAIPGDQVARLSGVLRPFPTGLMNPTKKQLSDPEILSTYYIPAVKDDNFIGGKLYGMPANVETLYLAYNDTLFRDLDDRKNSEDDEIYREQSEKFAEGPMVWNDLIDMAQVAVDRDGTNFKQAFIALGTGANVAHAEAIYSLLTKQAGSDITDPDRLRTGIALPLSSQDPSIPGQEAYNFLVSFSDPKEAHYTWNAALPNSLEALADGKVMMAFVYPRDIPKIMQRNPLIRLRYFAVPQIDIQSTPIDLASSFSLVIPRGTTHVPEAFEFMLGATKAGSGFVGPQKNEETFATLDRPGNLSIQRFQANTAQSYYKGSYPSEIDQAMKDLLDRKLSLEQAATKINTSLGRKILGS